MLDLRLDGFTHDEWTRLGGGSDERIALGDGPGMEMFGPFALQGADDRCAGKACALTSLTTACGILSLTVARHHEIYRQQ